MSLHVFTCLYISDRKYKKNEFVELTKEISGSLTAYDRYVYAKEHKENKRELSLNEGKKLYTYLKEYLQKIIDSVK